MITGQPDSDHDVYGQHLGPSTESLNSGCSSAPNLCDFGESQYTTGSEPYPAWRAKRNIPLSKEEISLDLRQEFGFQRCLMRNMVRFESCVSRHMVFVYLQPPSSILHRGAACKWYIAARLELDNAVGRTQNPL